MDASTHDKSYYSVKVEGNLQAWFCSRLLEYVVGADVVVSCQIVLYHTAFDQIVAMLMFPRFLGKMLDESERNILGV